MTNNPYGTPQSVPQHPGYHQSFQQEQSRQYMEGSKHAQTSLVFGIIGLFFLGIVFGPLAIVQAKKAEALNVPSSAGKILGWIDVVFGILSIIIFMVLIGTMGMSMAP
ncbi:hypothetical protein [Arthrobacter sp. H14]|uniref:hypothetical protein n=1 Tax=Arthrobacter sp. H14 TaxID=1312959 RepID=UPI0004B4283E|nr:hypothetical protein [Arthrobacter sp. H14]